MNQNFEAHKILNDTHHRVLLKGLIHVGDRAEYIRDGQHATQQESKSWVLKLLTMVNYELTHLNSVSHSSD